MSHSRYHRQQAPWRNAHRQGKDGDIQSVSSTLPSWAGLCVKAFMGITVGLYILNQKHLLPKPLSRIVSKALFWPTLPITYAKRIGSWMTVIDDTVVMGGAPFGFAGIPDKLYHEYGVSRKYYFLFSFPFLNAMLTHSNIAIFFLFQILPFCMVTGPWGSQLLRRIQRSCGLV